MLRRYVHGSNAEADDPLIWYEGSAQTATARRYVHADPRGSIVAVTNYTGTAIATNSYDAYGIPDTASGNDIATKGRFRYTGQAWIPELGLGFGQRPRRCRRLRYYYKARIYSPTLGRFLQTDPIGYEDQFNLYAYVANDPVNLVDPTGMYSCRGTDGECADFEVYVNNIREAAKSTNLSKHERGQLKSIADALGTNNGKGVNVEFGDLPEGKPGNYDSESDTITLDRGGISAYASRIQNDNLSQRQKNGIIGAALVVYEFAHKRFVGPSPAGTPVRLRDEITAYWLQGQVFKAYGIADPAKYPLWAPGMTLKQRSINNHHRAMDSCGPSYVGCLGLE